MMRLIILGFDHEMESANPELADVVEQLVKAEEVVLKPNDRCPRQTLIARFADARRRRALGRKWES
jgi:hypothetical protein